MKVSKLEKLINNNCFLIFLMLFLFVICYVMDLNNRPVKENFIQKQLKRDYRTNIRKIDDKIENKKQQVRRNLRKGYRNLKREVNEKKENFKQKIKNKMSSITNFSINF